MRKYKKLVKSFVKLEVTAIKLQPWWFKEVFKNAVGCTGLGIIEFGKCHLDLTEKVYEKMEPLMTTYMEDIEEAFGF